MPEKLHALDYRPVGGRNLNHATFRTLPSFYLKSTEFWRFYLYLILNISITFIDNESSIYFLRYSAKNVLKRRIMKYGFLFGAGAEVGYGMPSGGKFALDIFREDASSSKAEFRKMREEVDSTTNYGRKWLPEDFQNKNISSFGKTVFQNIIKDTVENNRGHIIEKINEFDSIAKEEVEFMLTEKGINIDEILEKITGKKYLIWEWSGL